MTDCIYLWYLLRVCTLDAPRRVDIAFCFFIEKTNLQSRTNSTTIGTIHGDIYYIPIVLLTNLVKLVILYCTCLYLCVRLFSSVHCRCKLCILYSRNDNTTAYANWSRCNPYNDQGVDTNNINYY